MAKVFLSDSILTSIANAIRSKLGTSGTYKPSEMVTAIESIETGGIDTSDATATAGDIVKPKTAYVNGEKVVGSLVKNNSLYLDCDTPELSGSNVQVTSQMYADTLVENGGLVYTSIPATEFGDAVAGDVAKGKTFTSAAGVKTVGTKENTSLPTLDTPADASNIEEGKQAIDGSGAIITGTLSTMVSVGKVASTVEVSGDNLEMSAKYDNKNIFDTSTTIKLKKALTNFGNATAADVAAGKTFTSAAGLKLAGTGEMLDTNTLSFETGSPITVPASARLIFFRVYVSLNANRMFIVDVVNKKVYGSPGITNTGGTITQLNTTGKNYDPSSNYDGHVTFNSDGTVKVNSSGDIQLAYI